MSLLRSLLDAALRKQPDKPGTALARRSDAQAIAAPSRPPVQVLLPRASSTALTQRPRPQQPPVLYAKPVYRQAPLPAVRPSALPVRLPPQQLTRRPKRKVVVTEEEFFFEREG